MKNLPVTALKGVGPKSAKAFEKMGIFTAEDLLSHYPSRFIRCPLVTDIGEAALEGSYAFAASPADPLTVIRHGSLVITQCILTDGSGTIPAVWYSMPYLKNTIKTSGSYIFFGRAVKKRGRFYLEQPAFYKPELYRSLMEGRLRPVYPLASGISAALMSKAVSEALKEADLPPEYLPEEIRREYDFIPEEEAVRSIHNPPDDAAYEQAKKRIVFDEFLHFLVRVQDLKKENDRKKSAFRMNVDGISEELDRVLPFQLTDAQRKAVGEIYADISGGQVMNRLLQGDVGSGKTAVALYALYAAARNGYQSAIMVPTEVLARQHLETLTAMLRPLPHPPVMELLTGSARAKEKREALKRIADGEADIVIGTHALIQESVEFRKLSLVITDEQHRFGVKQRGTLEGKGHDPHVLSMSATPIPRTLAVILYGDLSVSTLETKPSGRIPIKNAVIGPADRRKAYTHIRKEIEAGHQAYVICPLIEESELSDLENVNDYGKRLRALFGSSARIGLLNGKMAEKEKNQVMEAFLKHETDILVSTTVVEVGVDVPNATVMMIENADRFGLASLHQLRGRVGRGSSQSYCIFVNTSESATASKRLDILRNSNDGFEIAAADLKMRGPGQFFGAEQSGELTFGLGDIYNDSSVLQTAFHVMKTTDCGTWIRNRYPDDRFYL